MIPDLVIYHGYCPDGLSAAWCFWKKYPNIEYIPAKHGTEYETSGKKIIFVDFVYKKHIMEKLIEDNQVLVLDHHKSSEYLLEMEHENLEVKIDQSKSGCQLAWEYLNEEECPWYLNAIADIDLWNNNDPNSRLLTMGFRELGLYKDHEAFDKINSVTFDQCLEEGQKISAYENRKTQELLNRVVNCTTKKDDDTWNVKLIIDVNLYKSSEVADQVLDAEKKYDFFAMAKFDIIKNRWVVSLRAHPKTDIDLSVIAKRLAGGGGHPKASGFMIDCSNGDSIYNYFQPVKEPEKPPQ
jgi:oligoribonuclease NrnB/cAMP/cGMP phosphodiesterase (DHH superfamily)